MTSQRGFTVIEVLIASFILFLVISSASLIFSSTVKTKTTATQSLILYSYIPVLMDHIDVQLKYTNKKVGDGYFFGVNYHWQASIEEKKPVETKQNGVTGRLNEAIFWNVTLTVMVKAKTEVFNFNTVSWQRL